MERLESIALALDTLASAGRPSTAPDPASVRKSRAVLAELLQRKEYKRSWIEELLQRVSLAFAELIGDRVSDRFLALLGDIVLVGLIVAFVVAVVLLVLHLVRGGIRPAHTGDAMPVRAPARRIRPTIESLIAAAERDASEGRYRDAFRNVYLATLLLLDRSRLIGYTESGTNWEYLRSVRGQGDPEAAGIFGEMTSRFDDLVYGQREIEESGYARILAGFRELEARL